MRWIVLAVLGAGVVVGLVLACTVPDVDYRGKSCIDTCPTGLTCVDGSCTQLDALVYATNFHVAWVTPNSIRWAWTLQGKGTDLVSYDLVLTSPIASASGVKTWTSADNEELGGYQIKKSAGFDVVTGTITWELDPNTEYDAVLELTDVKGGKFTTQSVRAVTDATRDQHLVIFDGAPLTGGAFTYGTLAYSNAGCGVDGGACLANLVDSGSPPYQNLRIAGLALTADTSLNEKRFESAYAEFWVRGVGTPGSDWSETWLKMLSPDGATCSDYPSCIYHCELQWIYHPDPTAPGTYRRVQIPLSQFTREDDAGVLVDGGNLTLPTLLASVIDEYNVGCPYYAPDAKATYLDRIAIFW